MDPFGHLDGGSARRKTSTYIGQHNTEKREHTSMPRAGFEPMIPVFERPKTVRTLDRAAIGTGPVLHIKLKSNLTSFLSESLYKKRLRDKNIDPIKLKTLI
jgi:hypothetical protein